MTNVNAEIRELRRRLARLEGGGGDVLTTNYAAEIAALSASAAAVSLRLTTLETSATSAETRSTEAAADITTLTARPYVYMTAAAPTTPAPRIGDGWFDN